MNVTKSNFVMNTVNYGLIKVLSSSTLVMSNSTMRHNNARDCGGAIYVDNSAVHLANTNFSNNKAVRGGGAICAFINSSLWISDSTFKNNQILFQDSDYISKYGSGGAIYFENITVAKMHNVKFTANTAAYGGAIYFSLHSKLFAKNVYFIQNTANIGAAVILANHSMINISGVTCMNNIGNMSSCITTIFQCSVTIYNCMLSMNTGSVIFLVKSHFLMVNTSVFNNSTPFIGAGIISHNSTLHISDSDFYHKKGMVGGGALSLDFSSATVNSCIVFNNSNSAVSLMANTTILILNSSFEYNFSPFYGGALNVASFSVANVSNSPFRNNTAKNGGAVDVSGHSLLVVSHCLFSKNSAAAGEGTFDMSQVNMLLLHSLFSLNVTCCEGGSISSIMSSLVIHHTIFENNTANSGGGAISTKNSSICIEDSQFKHNKVQDMDTGSGGGLDMGVYSTAIISSVYFFYNKAVQGGAIYATDYCQITLFNNTIETNTGSAIYLDNVHSQINNSTFSNNLSNHNRGGAIWSKNCKLHVTKAVFKANKALDSGGAFFGWGTYASFHNCIFTDNSAFRGGAVGADHSNIELFATDFTKNSATEGGAFATSGNLLLVHCILNNNTAHVKGGVGYRKENSNINITTSVFRSNSAVHAGGALWLRKSIVNITNSLIAFNWAEFASGVIDAQFFSVIKISHITCVGNKIEGGTGHILSAKGNTTVWIQNSKFSNNIAGNCGILIDINSILGISHSQITRNYGFGGAFCIRNNSLSVIMNTSFMENTGYLAGSIVIMNSITYLENCTLRGNQGRSVEEMSVTSSDLKLSNTFFWGNKAKKVEKTPCQIGEMNTCQFSNAKFINKLYTYKSKFSHDNVTIRSNGTNFKQIVENHFKNPFGWYNQTILEMKETQFASSKNSFIFLMNFIIFVKE